MSILGVWLPIAFLLLGIWILVRTIEYIRKEFFISDEEGEVSDHG